MTGVNPAEGCPRCGDEVRLMSKGLQCMTPKCGGYWPDAKAYETECIARDLSGTRKRIGDPKITDTELQKQLDELVAAVRLSTLKDVEQGIASAIVGRNSRTPRGLAEISVLDKMLEWVRSEMKNE